MYRYFTAFLTLFVCSTVIAQTVSPLPVTRVTLYTSGVGYFERTGTVNGDSSSTLYFPIAQVNDVLKSLVLLDYDGGSIDPVTFGAQDDVSHQLKTYSVDLSDDPSEATLLDRLRGSDVSVTIGDGSTSVTTEGTIVGVETKTIQLPNQASTQQSTLTLMTGDSIVSYPLSAIANVQITDPTLRQELKEALLTVAEGRNTDARPVTLNFSGKGARKVLVGYLTQTPLWQTTYRLVLGAKPFLQGWALVQNTSSEDWTNVSLSLVAGRPISFIQDLYTPVYVDRPVVQPQVVGSPTPQLYSSNLDIDNSDRSSVLGKVTMSPDNVGGYAVNGAQITTFARPENMLQESATAPAEALPPSQLMQTALTATGAKLGMSLFSYLIKVPVTVPRQKSAMIPFVGTDIQAERVSIYNADVQADHPLTGARIKNTSGIHLMGGPITVFDENAAGGNGYVGDALIDDTEPGESQLISFAVDLAVDASKNAGSSTSRTTLVTIDKGILQSTTITENTTDYSFKNNSSDLRTIVVEQPYSNETLKEPATYSERTADLYRFDVPVAAGGSKDFKVVMQQTLGQSYSIVDLSDDNLLYYVRGTGISQQAKDALTKVSQLRALVNDTQAKITSNESQTAAISANQSRIRQNMQVLDKSSDLYKRYAGELDSQETSYNELATNHDALETELSNRQNDLNNYIQNLIVD